jgi:hypothetical protein
MPHHDFLLLRSSGVALKIGQKVTGGRRSRYGARACESAEMGAYAAMQSAICARIVESCSAVIRDSVALTIRDRDLELTCAAIA